MSAGENLTAALSSGVTAGLGAKAGWFGAGRRARFHAAGPRAGNDTGRDTRCQLGRRLYLGRCVGCRGAGVCACRVVLAPSGNDRGQCRAR